MLTAAGVRLRLVNWVDYSLRDFDVDKPNVLGAMALVNGNYTTKFVEAHFSYDGLLSRSSVWTGVQTSQCFLDQINPQAQTRSFELCLDFEGCSLVGSVDQAVHWFRCRV